MGPRAQGRAVDVFRAGQGEYMQIKGTASQPTGERELVKVFKAEDNQICILRNYFWQ